MLLQSISVYANSGVLASFKEPTLSTAYVQHPLHLGVIVRRFD